MKPYELIYIISSQTSLTDSDGLKKDVEYFVQNQGGVILKSEKSAPQSLAYPIKKHASGYFTTLEFQIEESKMKEIKEKLQKDAKILRHFIVVKNPLKERKKRRIRKPMFTETKPACIGYAQGIAGGEKASKGKVELEDIEKKLDEILSE